MSTENQTEERQRSTIDYWETIRKIVDRERAIGTMPLYILVTIERPVFVGGEKGFYRLNAKIQIGSHFIRLSTRAFIELLDILTETRGDILDATDEVHRLNQELKSEQGYVDRPNYRRGQNRSWKDQKDRGDRGSYSRNSPRRRRRREESSAPE